MNNKSSNNISRRKFAQLSGLSAASALMLGFGFKNNELQNISSGDALETEINPFVIVNKDGKIILMLHKPEMGQGTYQSMPVILAEELEVSLDNVTIQQANADKKFGDMSVGGSNSVKGSWMLLRKAGAAAKEMFITAAAQSWNVPVENCYAKNGMVLLKDSDKTASYGSLVDAASKLPVPKEPKLKDPKDFTLIGKQTKRPDIAMKTNGTALFGLDIKVPGMVYASVERCPYFHGTIKSFDDTAAKQIAGVKRVLPAERKLNKNTFYGVAVIADNYWAALQGRKALKIEWQKKDNATFAENSTDLYAKFHALAKTDGAIVKSEGNFDNAFASASKKIEAVYELPFAAHAPMEPQNTVAYVKDNSCEIWTPTQVPDQVQSDVSKYLNIPPENVIVHVTFLGGGFGRRLFIDSVMEAVYLSRELKAPVKSVWMREDDMSVGPFRPGHVNALKAGLDAKGNIVALQHKVVAPSIDFDQFMGEDATKKEDSGALEGVTESPYEIPNIKLHNIYAETPVSIGWWRSVYSATVAFAQESFIDELAYAAKKDPLDFRLNMITKNSKMKNLYETLREKSDWDKPLPAGWGKGIAAWNFFAGQAGHVVFVSKKDNAVKIEKIVAVIDCGTAVNPDNVRSQVEGATVMALTAAIKGEITLQDGMVVQKNFNDYHMMRMNEVPPIEVHVVNSADAPDGVGEPGLPPLAPALGNAIFAATGKRIRKLPFDINNIS